MFCRTCGGNVHPAYVLEDRCEDCWVDALVALHIEGNPPRHTRFQSESPSKYERLREDIKKQEMSVKHATRSRSYV